LIVELFPRAESDIIEQFRYYLVEKGESAAAFRFLRSRRAWPS
jgi:plasmid stabilization system protein ParE